MLMRSAQSKLGGGVDFLKGVRDSQKHDMINRRAAALLLKSFSSTELQSSATQWENPRLIAQVLEDAPPDYFTRPSATSKSARPGRMSNLEFFMADHRIPQRIKQLAATPGSALAQNIKENLEVATEIAIAMGTDPKQQHIVLGDGSSTGKKAKL